MLSFGEKIKSARKTHNLTQKQLAERIGAAHNSISDWENNKNKPDPDTIELLCGVLDITPNYLLATSPDDFSPEEKLIIKKYRDLDGCGKELVDFIIDKEWERSSIIAKQAARITDQAAQIEKLSAHPAVVEFQSSKDRMPVRYTLMQKIASAGVGFYFDDIPTDTLEAPYCEGADFIIGVNGDSMQPTYHDGDLVYVQKRQIVEIGDIGIFMVNNECYIKEAGEEGLISHNKKYPMIPGDESIQCIGKVLGKVKEQ